MAEGFLGGLAEGLQQGTNMGYLMMQARAMRENQMRQAQQMQMEQEKASRQQAIEEQKFEMEKGTAMLSLLKMTKDPKQKAAIWQSAAPKLNKIYGTQFDPSHFSVITSNVADQASDLMNKIAAKEIPYEQGMQRIAALVAIADEDQASTIEKSRQFLTAGDPMRAEIAKAKSGNADLGNATKLASVWAQAYDDARATLLAGNVKAKYGVEDPQGLQVFKDELDKEASRLFALRMGKSAQGAGQPTVNLPKEALDALKNAKGKPVTFGNGQTWKMVNGTAERVN